MENKRGQITIFIIIAILVVGGVALFFVLKGSIKKNERPSPEIAPIKNFMQECIDDQLEYGVMFIGLQGGYSVPPRNSLLTEFSNIAYGYYEGKNTLIALDEMEKEIGFYMQEVLPLCVNNDAFPEFELDYNSSGIKVLISEESVSAKIDFPVSIKKNDSVFLINGFESEVQVNLKGMHKTANEIINKNLDSNYLDLTSLANLGYSVDVLPLGENIFVYSISDKENKLDELPYTFNFAIKK